MKSILIGIVVAIAVAFAAHATYHNFSSARQADQVANQQANVTNPTDTNAAQAPVEPVALQQADVEPLAAATNTQPVVRTTANKSVTTSSTNVVRVEPKAPVAQTQQTTAAQAAPAATAAVATTAAPVKQQPSTANANNSNVKKMAANTNANATQDEFSNPDAISEYEFAFVDQNTLNNVSAAAEQAVQNVYEEMVLSPSAPR